MIVPRGMGVASPGITSLITGIANAQGVPPALALAVAQHESGFDPNAQNSTSSAAGLFQLINATQQQFGVTNPYDPTQNATAGITYLQQLLQKYNGDQNLALMAYSCGSGNVTKYQQTGVWPSICDPSYPAAIANIEGITTPSISTPTIPSLDTSTIDTSGDSSGIDLSSVDMSSPWLWAAGIAGALLLAFALEG